jgi:hypothetical protein
LCFAWHEEFQIQEKCGGVGWEPHITL